MTLTKADIVQAIQDHNEYSRPQAQEHLETLLELIKGSLEQNVIGSDGSVIISHGPLTGGLRLRETHFPEAVKD
jgi:Bacterial DNA-binding protein